MIQVVQNPLPLRFVRFKNVLIKSGRGKRGARAYAAKSSRDLSQNFIARHNDTINSVTPAQENTHDWFTFVSATLLLFWQVGLDDSSNDVSYQIFCFSRPPSMGNRSNNEKVTYDLSTGRHRVRRSWHDQRQATSLICVCSWISQLFVATASAKMAGVSKSYRLGWFSATGRHGDRRRRRRRFHRSIDRRRASSEF